MPIGTPEDTELLEYRFRQCCEKWLFRDYASISNLKRMIERAIVEEIYRGKLSSIFNEMDREIRLDGVIDYRPANLEIDITERRESFRTRLYARIYWGRRRNQSLELGFAYSDQFRAMQYSQHPPTLSGALGIPGWKPKPGIDTHPLPPCPKCHEKELPSATASWCNRCAYMMTALAPYGRGSNLGKAIGSAVKEHQERIKESLGYLRYLMTLGAAVLWEQADDSTKRFAMIELSEKPEEVRKPPREWVRPVPIAEPRPSQVDKWGGVGELLLELT